MIVKNTFSVTASNFSLIFKIMLFALVLVLLFAAIFTGILSPLMQELGEALNIESAVVERPTLPDGETFPEETSSLMKIFGSFGKVISEFVKINSGALWFALGMIILTIFLARFFIGILLLPAGKYLANKMTSGYSEGLWRTFLKHAKSSISLSFLSSIIFLVFDVGLSALIIYLAFLLGNSMGVFSVYAAVIALILVLSVRSALTGMWLPRVAMRDEKALVALKMCLRDTKKTFLKCFTGALALWILIFVLTAATVVFTLGLSFVIIIPLGIVMFIAMSMVQYCHFYGQNYFKDEMTSVKVVEDSVVEQK